MAAGGSELKSTFSELRRGGGPPPILVRVGRIKTKVRWWLLVIYIFSIVYLDFWIDFKSFFE